jgi:hypothetical protein
MDEVNNKLLLSMGSQHEVFTGFLSSSQSEPRSTASALAGSARNL